MLVAAIIDLECAGDLRASMSNPNLEFHTVPFSSVQHPGMFIVSLTHPVVTSQWPSADPNEPNVLVGPS